jgi:hypothetical protein
MTLVRKLSLYSIPLVLCDILMLFLAGLENVKKTLDEMIIQPAKRPDLFQGVRVKLVLVNFLIW